MVRKAVEQVRIWAEHRGIHFVVLGIALFAAAGLLAMLRLLVPDEYAVLRAMHAVLTAMQVLLVDAGLVAAGVWLAAFSDKTWRERLQVRLLHVGPNADKASLKALADGGHAASPLLERGRLYAWTGGALTLPGTVALLMAGGGFGAVAQETSTLVAFLAIINVLGLAVYVRGLQILGEAKRLMRKIAPPEDKPKRAPRPKAKRPAPNEATPS